MLIQLSAQISGGDLLEHGPILIGPVGISFERSDQAPCKWARIQRIGAEEHSRTPQFFRGATGAGIAALAAATLTGPVGIGLAAVAGAAIFGTKSRETFEIWSVEGAMAEVIAPGGTMKQCRVWHQTALAVLRAEGLVDPAHGPVRQGIASRLFSLGKTKGE